MINEVNGDTWDEAVLNAGAKPVAVDFWHNQCVWCQRLNPIFEELSEEFGDNAVFAKLNVRDSEANASVAQNFGIMGTPTIKVFCEGLEIGEVVGFMDKAGLSAELKRIFADSERCLKQTEAA